MSNILQYELENYPNHQLIAGFDEVGRGAIAGPVVVACVILKSGFSHHLIKDSKQLNSKQRIMMSKIIRENAVAVSIKSHDFVDIHNPKQSSILGMNEAFTKLSIIPEVCLVDFEEPQFPNFSGIVEGIVKGDQKSLNIAAASIIAKVVQEQIMIKYDQQYPHYGFKTHKGYYTKNHALTLEKHGACQYHRKSCVPVQKYPQKILM
ncbi:ribonuclease HII [Spiroplasma endosymbiont of Nebria brevicollis]|uniref:ribonuclease HII n=1 Tax=Spiroplasma endosymbiont of Nebria brevicollis TaxID=3066284 RepID=UPI00313D563F